MPKNESLYYLGKETVCFDELAFFQWESARLKQIIIMQWMVDAVDVINKIVALGLI